MCFWKGERIEQSRSMCPFPSLNAIIVCILNIRFIPRASISHKHFVQTFRLLRKSSTRIKEIVSSRAGFSIRHVYKNRFSCRLKGFFFFFFFWFCFQTTVVDEGALREHIPRLERSHDQTQWIAFYKVKIIILFFLWLLYFSFVDCLRIKKQEMWYNCFFLW